MSTATATKTYRARSLSEALVQVREELGPNAIVVRRREGLEGGVAGFFKKAVVEIEAQPGGPSLDVRDDESVAMPEVGPAMPEAAPADVAPVLAREAAAAGFAAALATAQGTAPTVHTDPAIDAIPQPRDSAPEVVPVRAAAPAFVAEPVAVAVAPAAAAAPAPLAAPAVDHPEAERVLGALRRAGLSESFATTVVDEAAIHGLPFATGEGHALRPFVARALARRLEVAPVNRPCAVAVVGAGGSGKTAVIARLAMAYAAAGRIPVAVIALRSKDGGAELARLLAPAGVPMWATDDVEGAAARIANLRRGALVLVDTPALPAQMSADPFVTDALGADLRRLGIDEVHLALPAVLAGEVARDMLTAARSLGADRLAVTHSDATARLGMVVELAAEAGLPISYLADTAAVRPAAAEDLAFALLP
jgi:flagellar biosynthesis protein FlhF